MNINKSITFGLIALFLMVPFFQVNADFSEGDVTGVGSEVVQVTQTSEDFPENEDDTTKVGSSSNENQVASSNDFPENENDVTTVGKSSDENQTDSSEDFPEGDTTTVGEEPSQRRSGGSSGSTIRNTTSGDLSSDQGEVLGATTEENSCVMLTTFMRLGMDNNVEEVKLLQSFLNSTIGANLPVTGFFGPMTDAAVRMFQVQYGQQVLLPWVNLGLHSSVNIATGYVYKTTTYTINSMLCPQAEISYPVLF